MKYIYRKESLVLYFLKIMKKFWPYFYIELVRKLKLSSQVCLNGFNCRRNFSYVNVEVISMSLRINYLYVNL